MKTAFKRVLRGLGLEVSRVGKPRFREGNPDVTDFEWRTIQLVRPFTFTKEADIVTLVRAVEYVVKRDIPGDIVECGVWRGGSAMAIAEALAHFQDSPRSLCLYDTFAGMTEPTAADVDIYDRNARALMDGSERTANVQDVWAYAPLVEVRANMARTALEQDRVRFIEGPVEQTIPAHAPERISLLRLDTDWYESTKHELTHLYPRLSRGGILIIDDYGHWRGTRKAVDEFFQGHAPFLMRLNSTCRIAVKIEEEA